LFLQPPLSIQLPAMIKIPALSLVTEKKRDHIPKEGNQQGDF